MGVRLAKVVLVAAIGLLALIIVVNNLQDPQPNFLYIQHVMSMDTTFPESQLRWRAIAHPTAHWIAYGLLIATEAAIAALCLLGALQLWRAMGQPAEAFDRAKGVAIAGLTLAFLLWFVGFMGVGGEWFAMWQSETWNGQQAAFRFIGCVGIVLLFLNGADRDLPD
jgi:predicted small integral membrane protein